MHGLRGQSSFWSRACCLQRLQPLFAEQPRRVELPGQIHLPGANPLALALVHPQGHQIQVCNHVVEFWADGAEDDVVHAELVPL